MKFLGIIIITLYQQTLSPLFRIMFGPQICRYNPSCSEYTKQQIRKYGLVKGSMFGLKQLSTCHPFAK